MDIHPKISVIVPVYNVERYLRRCIDSILAQTFTDFELILIDDGSKDQSGKICDEYAAIDKRIRVFHKENGGVSSARNVGLDNARGEWLAFIDSDDAIDINYLFLDGNLSDIDVVEKGYNIYSENGYLIKKVKVKNHLFLQRDVFLKHYVNKRTGVLWTKIIRKKLTEGLYFDTNVRIGEDLLFFLGLIAKIRKFKYSSFGRYYYYLRDSSAMGQIKYYPKVRIVQLWENISHIENILQDQNLYLLRNGIIYRDYLMALFHFLRYMSDNDICNLRRMYGNMTCERLRYVSLGRKIKLYISKWLFSKDSFVHLRTFPEGQIFLKIIMRII